MRAETIATGSRVLRQRTAIFAAVLALGLGNIGIANAQAIYFGPRVYDAGLPPHEIMRIVRSTGLAPLTRPARRGPYYVLLATNRSGGQMRVVVDAYAGDIVRVNPMLVAGLYGPQPAAPYGPPPRIVTGPSELDDPPLAYTPNTRFDGGVPPVPPRAVPGARIATAPGATLPSSTPAAPPHTGALPARTPMPRPRPNVAAINTPAAHVAAPAAVPETAPASAPSAAPGKDESAAKTAPAQMIPVAPLE
jgi:hypothetical protein